MCLVQRQQPDCWAVVPGVQGQWEGSRISAVFGMPTMQRYRESGEPNGLTHLAAMCDMWGVGLGESNDGEDGLITGRTSSDAAQYCNT